MTELIVHFFQRKNYLRITTYATSRLTSKNRDVFAVWLWNTIVIVNFKFRHAEFEYTLSHFILRDICNPQMPNDSQQRISSCSLFSSFLLSFFQSISASSLYLTTEHKILHRHFRISDANYIAIGAAPPIYCFRIQTNDIAASRASRRILFRDYSSKSNVVLQCVV